MIRDNFELTPTQAGVAYLLASGLTNTSIASQLHASPHTIRRHTEAIYEKLGVCERTAVEKLMIEYFASHVQ